MSFYYFDNDEVLEAVFVHSFSLDLISHLFFHYLNDLTVVSLIVPSVLKTIEELHGGGDRT